jgi:hypothetical protein
MYKKVKIPVLPFHPGNKPFHDLSAVNVIEDIVPRQEKARHE